MITLNISSNLVLFTFLVLSIIFGVGLYFLKKLIECLNDAEEEYRKSIENGDNSRALLEEIKEKHEKAESILKDAEATAAKARILSDWRL